MDNAKVRILQYQYKAMPIDYRKYPPNWKSEIRPAVLKRANNCCEFCGLENKQIVYGGWVNKKKHWFKTWEEADANSIAINIPIKVVLTIAHLDHDETNHDVSLDRLAALCQLCHLRYDAKEKYRRVMEKENSKK